MPEEQTQEEKPKKRVAARTRKALPAKRKTVRRAPTVSKPEPKKMEERTEPVKSTAEKTDTTVEDEKVDVDTILKDHLQMGETQSTKLEQASRGMSKAFGAFLGILVAVVAAALVGIVVVGVGIYRFGWKDDVTLQIASVVPYPIAVVDTKIIQYDDYLNDFRTLKKYYVAQAEANAVVADVSDDELFTSVKERMIDEAMVELLAKDLNVTVTEDEISAEWQTITGNGSVSEEEIRQTLSDLYGWTPEQFREKVIRPFALRQNVSEAIAASDSLQQESRARAQEVLAAVQKGEKSFEDLAKEFGEDGTAANGGDLGFFERGTMVEEFQTAVESLEVGEVSGLVTTQFGFHVIKLEEKVPAEAKEGEEPPAEGEFSYRARHILILYKGIDDVIKEKKDAVRFYEFI